MTVRARCELQDDVVGYLFQRDERELQRLDLRFELGDGEQLFDQAAQAIALPVGCLQERAPLLVAQIRPELQKRLEVALDRRQRRP